MPAPKDPFFTEGHAEDPTYSNLRDEPLYAQDKQFVEALWDEYHHLADDQFLTEVRRCFSHRYWEMYLACSLRRRGLRLLPKQQAGPDIQLDVSGASVWLEATCPGPGTGPDRIPEPPQKVAHNVPEEKLLQRLTGAIRTKYLNFVDLISKPESMALPTDPFVIALNGSDLRPYAMTEDSIPYIVKALFGIGNQSILLGRLPDEGIIDSFRSSVPLLNRVKGDPISATTFLDGDYPKLSGIIYSKVHVGSLHHDILGQDYLFIPNPHALNPVPQNLFAFCRSFRVEGDELKFFEPDAFILP